MTTMVLTIDLVNVLIDTIEENGQIWRLKHVEQFLKSLEAVFWHARSFNQNHRLRRELHQRKFMKFDDESVQPHLLEQEILSLSLVQKIILQLQKYDNSNISAKTLFDCWLQK